MKPSDLTRKRICSLRAFITSTQLSPPKEKPTSITTRFRVRGEYLWIKTLVTKPLANETNEIDVIWSCGQGRGNAMHNSVWLVSYSA
jgi:hypothetical protein